MTTARRSVPTARASLESIHAAGWDDVVVSKEPGFVPEVTAIRSNLGPVGAWTHFQDICKIFHRFDLLVVFQDDISICRNLRPWIEQQDIDWNAVGVLSLWTPGVHHKGTHEWWTPYIELNNGYAVIRSYGALAVILPAATVRAVCDRNTSNDGRQKADQWLGQVCIDIRKPWVYPGISFVQHTGEKSAISSDPRLTEFRLAKNWFRDPPARNFIWRV